MRKILLSTILAVLVCCGVHGRDKQKWFVAPSAHVVEMNGKYGFGTSLTAGRFLGERNQFRVDLLGSYVFAPGNNDVCNASGLFVVGDMHKNELFYTASVGVGAQKQQGIVGVDLIVPIRANFGYYITPILIISTDIMYFVNTKAPRERSYTVLGMMLGFKF